MKEYEISIPIVGVAYVTVQAKDEKEAIELALDSVDHVEEWEALRTVVSGNVWNSTYGYELSIDRVKELSDED